MKKQKLYGRRANWDALKVSAINNKTFMKEHTSDFPQGQRIVAVFIGKYDYRNGVLREGVVTPEEAAEILENAPKAAFTLIHEGLIVGYAYYRKRHRRHRKLYKVRVTFTNTEGESELTYKFPVVLTAYSHRDAERQIEAAVGLARIFLPDNTEVTHGSPHRYRPTPLPTEEE